MDFHCEPDYKIGLFGSCFLLGMVIGCLTLARLGDVHGRKKIFLLGMSCQLMATAGLLISRSELVDYLLLMLLGWSITGKQYVGYTYLLEL